VAGIDFEFGTERTTNSIKNTSLQGSPTLLKPFDYFVLSPRTPKWGTAWQEVPRNPIFRWAGRKRKLLPLQNLLDRPPALVQSSSFYALLGPASRVFPPTKEGSVRLPLGLKIALLCLFLASFGGIQEGQAQSYLFSRADFIIGTNPGGVAVGDFNGDGRLDAAITDSISQTVTILLGESDGTFKHFASYAAGYETGTVVTGDFNRDGKTDLAVANWVGSSVSIYLGNGDGTFEAPITTNVPYYASELAVADFNKDGKLDLAVTSNSAFSVYVLLGRGDGSFQAPVTYTTPSYPIGIVAEDFNRDGHIDLAMADTYGNDVYVLLGKGDGTFQPGGSFAAGEVAVGVAAGDFNGDGFLDLAVTDGPDCGCGFVSILLGNGDGTFQAPSTTDTPGPAGQVVVGDFNRDHKLDIAFNMGGNIYIGLGKGDGTFGSFMPYGSNYSAGVMALGDFNRDGIIDIVTGDYNGNNSTTGSILLGNGDGTFGRSSAYATGLNPLAIVTADFNGDGRKDLATLNSGDNTVSILLGAGGGVFNSAVNYPIPGGGGMIVAADFNGDGKPDLAITNPTAGSVSILLSQGDGTFAGHVDYAVSKFPQALAAGVFTSDGKVDLVIGCSGGLVILRGKGDGTFETPKQFAAGLIASSIAVSDFNHDGKLDLAVGNPSYTVKSVSVLLGNGNGTFATAVNYPAGTGPGLVVAADVDEDGNQDLVVAGSGFVGGSGVSVLFGKGDGTFWGPDNYDLSGTAMDLRVADLNGDGRPDIAVITNLSNPRLSILRGRGYGTFLPFAEYAVGPSPAAMVLADLDGNGSLDVAVTNTNNGGNTVTVLLNRPAIALSSAKLSFAGQKVGTTSPSQTATISNPGSSRLTLSSFSLIGVSPSDFTLTTNCPKMLSEGASCSATISFQPSAKGTRSAGFKITDNALGRTQVVALQGTGQ
jgi:hypothetical protein